MDHGLTARRGGAGNLLVCASCRDGPQNGTEAQISCPGQTRAEGRVLPRVSAVTAACSPLRSLGSALPGRALQELQRRLSWGMLKETGDQASLPCRNWKLSRYQTT